MVISHIQEHLAPDKTTWLNHWHAVSGRFDLSTLPSSPPSTPAPPGEGLDYFSHKVFGSAVSVPDYQQSVLSSVDGTSAASQPAIPVLRSPRPAVAPCSINVSVTERYIPPTSSAEFRNLFLPSSGRSLLSDRLVELSENSGILVFVYPTRDGSETFIRDYLGTVLDPLLRSMMVRQQVTSELCHKIGRMPAVADMLSFSELKARLQLFLAQISSGPACPEPISTFHSISGVPVSYTLEHAATAHVRLAPDVWTDWWCRQEKARISAVFDEYVRQFPGRARSASSQANVPLSTRERMREDRVAEGGGAMSYILEVLEGVRTGAVNATAVAAAGEKSLVEVGVFVVKKQRLSDGMAA
jgi:hypothetical protein